MLTSLMHASQAAEEPRQTTTGMDMHVEVPFSMAAHVAAPPRLSALLLPPPPPPPPPGTAPNAVAAAATAAAAAASRQALPVGEVCVLTAAVRVTAPCEVGFARHRLHLHGDGIKI